MTEGCMVIYEMKEIQQGSITPPTPFWSPCGASYPLVTQLPLSAPTPTTHSVLRHGATLTTYSLEIWLVFELATSEPRGDTQPGEPQNLTPTLLLIKLFTFVFCIFPLK